VSETHDVVWTPEKIGATWDFFGTNRGGSTWYFSSHAGRWIVKRADRELGLGGKRILDFGCGRGDLLAHIFARGIAARGLEPSEDSADETRQRFAAQPLFRGVETVSAKLEDESYDVIFLVEVIEHLLDDQLEPVLAEVRRLLAPGGAVVVTCPNGEDLGAERVRCPDCGAAFHPYQHVRSLDPTSIAALFESHAFRTQTSAGVYWGLTPYAVVRTWLRNPGRLPKPHLLYIGRR
jgi:SAM-dependent methyltransferase